MRQRQRGVALITAVMIVAFATTLAAGLMVTQNMAVHRATNLMQYNQAWWYLIGLEEWASSVLRRDRTDNNAIDYPGDPWAQAVDFLPVDEGVLAGRITDLNSRFDLNSLAGENAQANREQFVRLLQNIEALRSAPAEQIAAAIADWIDPDSTPTFPNGAEDSVYLSRDLPYRTANQPLTSLSELLLIDGIDRDIYTALLPYVAAYPERAPINVNTASPELLLSLHPDLTPADIENIVARREAEPFDDVQKLLEDDIFAGRDIQVSNLAVKSRFFQAEGAATIGRVQMRLVSLLDRSDSGAVHVVRHAKSSL